MLKLKLEQVMYDKRINTRQLSEKTGIRWNTIDNMVKNESKHWSIENLEKIMLVLGIEDIGEIIEYKKESSEA